MSSKQGPHEMGMRTPANAASRRHDGAGPIMRLSEAEA